MLETGTLVALAQNSSLEKASDSKQQPAVLTTDVWFTCFNHDVGNEKQAPFLQVNILNDGPPALGRSRPSLSKSEGPNIMYTYIYKYIACYHYGLPSLPVADPFSFPSRCLLFQHPQ